MRRRNIKSVLRRKLDDWCTHIDDDKVKALVKEDAIISGGSLASMLMGEKVNDFDVYFRTKQTALAVAQYYVKKFKENPPSRFANDSRMVNIAAQDCGNRIKIVVKSQGIAGENGTDEYQYFEQVDPESGESDRFVEQVTQDATDTVEADKEESKPKYRPRFLTSNAITLSHRIQVVIRFWGSPQDIHMNYDFVHCMCAWEPNGTLTIPQDAVESMLARHLKYRGSLYPLCSFIRTRKFLSRGWTIDAGQYVKMAWDLHTLDLSNISVLEDQMVGVDAAYFYEVLRLLRERESDKVDGAYLMQVIDRVFG